MAFQVGQTSNSLQKGFSPSTAQLAASAPHPVYPSLQHQGLCQQRFRHATSVKKLLRQEVKPAAVSPDSDALQSAAQALQHPPSASHTTGTSTPSAASGPFDPTLSLLPLGLDLDSYPSMHGRNVLVTGSARGIGRSTARLLAALGASVYITDMRAADIAAAAAAISAVVPGAAVAAAPPMDLASFPSVAAFASAFADQLRGQPLHVLVNNAGANFMGVDPWHTAAGVAGIPQVNVLGPFALTQQLRPLLQAAGPTARLVSVASVMHRKTSMPEDLGSFFTDWWVGGSYRNCKLAAVLLTGEAQRRWGDSGLVATAADPGAVQSGIWASSSLGRPPLSWVLGALFASPWDAAASSLHAAACAHPVPAGYYARGLFAADPVVAPGGSAVARALAVPLPVLDWPLRRASGGALAAGIASVAVAEAARDEALAARLWDACLERIDDAGLKRL